MSLVRLNIKGISYSQTQSGAYALILSEVDGRAETSNSHWRFRGTVYRNRFGRGH